MRKLWAKPEIIFLTKTNIQTGSIFIMGSEGKTMTFKGNVMSTSGTLAPCTYTTIYDGNAEMDITDPGITLFACS